MNKKLERERDLQLMLVVTLKKERRKKIIQLTREIKSLDLLSEEVLNADKKELKISKEKINSFFE